jgi:A/G-specific adenine glycosylase
MITPVHDAAWRRLFRRRLVAWFRQNARDLPWRRTQDAYHVWVSEIMLQQTQVATVVPYFQRFLASFPTIRHLAEASEDQVLKHWEGLGYYRRARQLHQAARAILEHHNGQFPSSVQEARALPGIGRYTAAAILSIAHDARLPILEANTTRLFCRLLAYAKGPSTRAGQDVLWNFAEEILPASRVGEFNQALMELGSLVCKPRDPLCSSCPVAALCPTLADGRQHEIPVAKQGKKYESSHEACVVVWRRGRVLVRHCLEQERWAGLWDFPRFKLSKHDQPPRQVRDGVLRQCQIAVIPGELLTRIKHGVTRFRITLDCYQARWRAGRIRDRNLRWVEPSELEHLPLSMTARKISRLL